MSHYVFHIVNIAQACWVVSCFSTLKYKDAKDLAAILGMVRQMLHGDKELPVRVEAAMALQDLITDHEDGKMSLL